jgi:predicted nucleic acid-binding Zn finger protein
MGMLSTLMKKERLVDYRDVLKALEKVRGLDLIQLIEDFGERGEKAWELLRENRVKCYTFKPSGRVVWIVVGRGGDHLIYSAVGYCGCDDFYFSVMEGKALVCQHLIAQRLADKQDWFDTIEESDDFFDVLMDDWRISQQGTATTGRTEVKTVVELEQ